MMADPTLILGVTSMGWEAWFTIGVVALVTGALLTNRVGVDTAMVGGLTILMLADVLNPVAAVSGFAHPAVIIIGAMFVIAAGLEETGGMQMLAERLLGKPKSLAGAQARLMVPVSTMSALMNTTPIVAAYLPIVADWSRKLKLSPSKLYLPLSYAAIFGGMCTMIGTSSNITVNELFLDYIRAQEESAGGSAGNWLASFGITSEGQAGMQFYWMGIVGVPAAILATLVVIATTKWLLPARVPAAELAGDERQYTVEMEAQAGSSIVGRTIEQAGLRQLPGLYLTEIERGEQALPAVGPDTRIEAGDRMRFVGVVESVVDLRKIRGLVPATDQVEKVDSPRRAREVVEAVVSHNSPLAGRTVKESQFRTRYNAAIIAVARKGQRIARKIGDIRLQPGDTILMLAHPGFAQVHRNRADFYLVSQIEDAREVRHERAWLSLGILVVLVGLLALSPLHPIAAAFFCAVLMVGTRCVTGTIARKSVRWQILLTIGAAIGIGRALTETHAAEGIAHGLMSVIGDSSPYIVLFCLFMLTALFAQLITNNGAAVLMFPIAMFSVQELGLNPQPFVLAVLIAAACNLMSPVSYQTNLMVYGPGGYRFSDFLRIGIPITIAIGLITVLIAPLMFPFAGTSG